MNAPILIWHRRDLRTRDNRALFEASKISSNIIPIFVFDPHFWESDTYCHDRLELLLQSIEDLASQYEKLGTRLVLLHGKAVRELAKLSRDLGAQVFFNHDTNGEYGMKRDRAAIDLGFTGWQNDAIQRQGRTSDWSSNTAKFFNSDIYPTPTNLSSHTLDSTVTTDDIRKIYSITPTKTSPEKGGSLEAHLRLKEFLGEIKQYTKSISKPLAAETGTSRLSAHFSLGTISIREVYQATQAIEAKQKSFYTTRLFWNQHFTQKLHDNPTLDRIAANPVFESNYDQIYQPDKELFQAWCEGKTGYPLIDASMRALTTTGFLNFRMRAMTGSFLTYILKQPWQWGADFMFHHLIDADRAINYSQWQMQSGMVGVHPNRIYNPTTNLHKHDPDAAFVRKYIPELREANLDFIMADPETRQDTLFGDTYIPPIVSFTDEMRKARTIYKELNKQAFDLVQTDLVLRSKLSLSGAAAKRTKNKQLPDTKEV